MTFIADRPFISFSPIPRMRDRRGAPTPKRGAGAESPTPTHVAIAECGGGMPKLFVRIIH